MIVSRVMAIFFNYHAILAMEGGTPGRRDTA